jgi:hypothetical protein
MTDEIMSYEDFVHQVISALEAAGVRYMIGGAVAAWAWGEPRATLDLDVVVDIPLTAVNLLSKELQRDCIYVKVSESFPFMAFK